MTSYHIIERIYFIRWNDQSYYRFSSFLLIFFNLFRSQVPAVTTVNRCLTFDQLFFSFLLQFFFGAVAIVSLTFIEQTLNFFLINIQSFRLSVWAIISAYINAFIPGKAKPLHSFLDVFFGFSGRASQIGIFYTYQEGAACVSGNQPVEQCRTGSTNMKRTCRAWCKSYFNFVFHNH